jgi:hypothetical protein
LVEAVARQQNQVKAMLRTVTESAAPITAFRSVSNL